MLPLATTSLVTPSIANSAIVASSIFLLHRASSPTVAAITTATMARCTIARVAAQQQRFYQPMGEKVMMAKKRIVPILNTTTSNMSTSARPAFCPLPLVRRYRAIPEPSVAAFRRPMLPRGRFTAAVGRREAKRFLSTTPALRKIDPKKAVPAQITEAQYNELADEYLETILSKFEELQDEGEDLDVEFAAGVLELKMPFGTFVVNKQPPNKQIWLSSPKSGPKRYDWVVVEGQDAKEGTGHGDWIYGRDGSTINELFLEETGIDLYLPVPHFGGQ
ncbi:uncharacterized protein MKZ38_006813 [Zalerion maritima]|uniref:ferroxidase n=1 Tax=Zalerion maritima TaxID=339359 RepID=A0AAD5RX85_9PEZI|nr:uncharacterized protein MKZ38_006813 [Zalerion maritima]